MSKTPMVICECGNVYAGEEYYYKKRYCDKCGRWLRWDKHSNIDPEYTQFETDINLRREARNG